MEKSSKGLPGTPGACESGKCESCGSESSKSGGLSRRDFGSIALTAAAASVLAGCSGAQKQAEQKGEPAAPPAPAAPAMSPDLEVVKKEKGPILTTLDEFYKMGPGPSSSHTMGVMRCTYDFFQRVSKLPEDQLKRSTALQVNLFGSLSATGKGHGTERAALAGLLGKAPADCPPQFLDGMAAKPEEVHKVTIGPTTFSLTLKNIIYDAARATSRTPTH